MARKLRSYDFTESSALTSTSSKAIYPWDEWLDGDIWELTFGEDFQTHPLMMERIIRTRAAGRKAKVQMRHIGINAEPFGVIVLERTDITGPEEAKRLATIEKRRKTLEAKKNSSKANGETMEAPPVVRRRVRVAQTA